ncbi:ATP-binding protein [Curtobacterium citreum]
MANTRPDYPTMVAGRMQDGRLIGVDQSVWLYKKVPLAPVTEAKTTERALVAALPLVNAYETLAQMTPVRSNRRALTRAQYRDTHALLVNIPTAYRPAPSDIDAYLAEQYAGERVYNRFLLFGVKLQSTVGDGGFQAAINSVTQTLLEGGTPISDYDKDFRQVDQALSNAGLQPMTAADFRMANSWWNQGQFPDTPTLFHSDHMHVFGSAEATSIVQQIGADQCEAWPPLSDTSTVTFASVQDLDLPFVDAGTSTAQWISPYIRADASIVSIRALVEPSKVTRDELRRNRKQNMDDLNERMREQKMDRAELDEKIETLEAVENGYASGGGPATLVDASILMAFDGRIEDMSEMSSVNVSLNAMLYRQKSAWAETMLCSNVRANPNRHDLPDTTIAYSGLPSLSTVGDTSGAMVGFTESDRQPALLSPTAVAQEDRTPICVVAAASGAGKSMMMLWLADQFARMGRPCVIIDPKALALDVAIPTPTGWRKNGDLRVGDQVFDRHGRPTTITALSPLFEQADMYEVTFDDGQTIKADGQHRWVVSDAAGRAAGSSDLLDLTTNELLERGVRASNGGVNFTVPLGGAAQYPTATGLAIDPFEAGRLVGEGEHDFDPAPYLTGDVAQRREFLAGMASLTAAVSGGIVRFSFAGDEAAAVVLELARSLGYWAALENGEGRTVVMNSAGTRTDLRIVSITPIASEPARCIRVDADDHTYLAAGYIPTHNTGSDHSGATGLSDGQVASLDDFISSDGVLDPLRFAITRQDGVDMAASMILSVNPFGTRRADLEVPLISALNFGVGYGAACIGQALLMATKSDPGNEAWAEVYRKVLELANASSQFRAMVGFEPGTEALRIADGITLIKVGKTSLNLPTPGTPMEQTTIPQRVSLALVRMMIFGAATALTGRDGVIFQDEAWTILNSDPKEVERLGRLARSQRVLPILFSQDISGAAKAGLAGYISRGFVGPITDPDEALAAMELFGIEPTDERMARVTASATMDAYGNDELAAPNYNSMKALRDPRTRKVLRGSVWMYSDLSGRVIPVECVIPPEFLRIASTNALDIDEREKQAAAMRQAA